MITHQTCNTYEQIPKVSAFTSIHELTLNTTSMFQKGITLHLKTNKADHTAYISNYSIEKKVYPRYRECRRKTKKSHYDLVSKKL